jgi:hypothetical protein
MRPTPLIAAALVLACSGPDFSNRAPDATGSAGASTIGEAGANGMAGMGAGGQGEAPPYSGPPTVAPSEDRRYLVLHGLDGDLTGCQLTFSAGWQGPSHRIHNGGGLYPQDPGPGGVTYATGVLTDTKDDAAGTTETLSSKIEPRGQTLDEMALNTPAPTKVLVSPSDVLTVLIWRDGAVLPGNLIAGDPVSDLASAELDCSGETLAAWP